NASCFSAVRPVCGWNQWQKWLAPLPSAHSLIACATSLAMAGSRRVPRRIVSCRDLNTGLGSFSFIALTSNVLLPNTSTTFAPLDSSGTCRMLRDMAVPTAHSRPETSDMTHLLLEFAAIIGTGRPANLPIFLSDFHHFPTVSAAGHDAVFDRDLVLDLDRSPRRAHRLHAELVVAQDGLPGGGQGVAGELDVDGKREGPCHSVQRDLPHQLEVVGAAARLPAAHLLRLEGHRREACGVEHLRTSHRLLDLRRIAGGLAFRPDLERARLEGQRHPRCGQVAGVRRHLPRYRGGHDLVRVPGEAEGARLADVDA